MPTLEEALRELRGVPFIIRFRGRDPADADAVVAAFAGAGVKIEAGHGFYGDPAVTARLRQLAPAAWVFDAARLGDCAQAYPAPGWRGRRAGC
jgi:glycerophosphoryl diester phosphodiesterase